jgi:hypothetical protein
MKLVRTALLLTLATATAGMLSSRARRARLDAGPAPDGTRDAATPGRGIVGARQPNAGEQVQAALAGGDGALAGSALAHDDLLAPGSSRDAFGSSPGVADPMRGA